MFAQKHKNLKVLVCVNVTNSHTKALTLHVSVLHALPDFSHNMLGEIHSRYPPACSAMKGGETFLWVWPPSSLCSAPFGLHLTHCALLCPAPPLPAVTVPWRSTSAPPSSTTDLRPSSTSVLPRARRPLEGTLVPFLILGEKKCKYCQDSERF